MTKFYNDGAVWVLGDMEIPAGTMIKRNGPDGVMEICRYYDYASSGFQTLASGKYSDFSDANGVPYASLAAFKAATDSFFVKASSGGGATPTDNTTLPTLKVVADTVSNLIDENSSSYGVIIDSSAASPVLQRVGSPLLHRSQPILSAIKACILNDNAEVVYYLNSNDVTKKADGTPAKLDGTDGQVMLEFPTMYRKITDIDATKTEIRFSMCGLPKFEKIEGFYYAPMMAAVHRPTNKLSSVISNSPDYRGGNNNAALDAQPQSQLGMAATSLSRPVFRSCAQNRGVKYIDYAYYMNEVLAHLYQCEYANLNIQEAYNPNLTAEGYKQGGLGEGVTTINNANWNLFNSNYPLIPNGAGFQAIGVNTGIKPYTISGLGVNVDIPVWHGIENIFGHLWQSEDGVNIEIQANDSGGLSKAYICKNIRFFADTITDGYVYVGNIPRTEGFITKMIKGTILPLVIGGSSNTYYCDYNNTNIPTTGVNIRQMLRGGAAHHGSYAGFGCSGSHFAPSTAYAAAASRLCAVKNL